jgi:hypothetical protein
MLGELLPFVLPMAVALALRLWLASRNSGGDGLTAVRTHSQALRTSHPATAPPISDIGVRCTGLILLPGRELPGRAVSIPPLVPGLFS